MHTLPDPAHRGTTSRTLSPFTDSVIGDALDLIGGAAAVIAEGSALADMVAALDTEGPTADAHPVAAGLAGWPLARPVAELRAALDGLRHMAADHADDAARLLDTDASGVVVAVRAVENSAGLVRDAARLVRDEAADVVDFSWARMVADHLAGGDPTRWRGYLDVLDRFADRLDVLDPPPARTSAAVAELADEVAGLADTAGYLEDGLDALRGTVERLTVEGAGS